MKILVIAAHPDDEILGVGGVICKHISNDDSVYVCIVTQGYEPKWPQEHLEKEIKQQKKVDEFLNIKKRYILDFHTAKLNTVPHGAINKKITDIVDEVDPDIIYTHYENDLHFDHTLIFKASLVATRPPKNIKLLCYEILSETEWNIKPFQPNIWVNIKEFIDRKIEAFKIYTAEVKKYPHPRSPEGIKILAQKRGSEVCMEFAEVFMLIRDFWI